MNSDYLLASSKYIHCTSTVTYIIIQWSTDNRHFGIWNNLTYEYDLREIVWVDNNKAKLPNCGADTDKNIHEHFV